MTYYPPPNQPYAPAYPPAGFPPGPALVPAGPRQYSVFHALVLFWSPKLWRDVGQRWRGIGLTFMFLLLLLTTTPGFVKAMIGFNKYVRDDASSLTGQVPKVTIQNGVASADVPQPYYITEPESGTRIICIDTTGTVTKPTKETPFLLTRDSLAIRKETGEIQSMDLADVQYYQIDSQKALGYFQTLRTWVVILGLPVLIVMFMIGRLILMLLYGALGLAFNGGFGARLTYAGCMRLAAISMTPVVLIDTVLGLAGVGNGGCAWTIGGIVLALVVLALAVKANGQAGPAPVGPPGFQVVPAWNAPPPAGPYGYAPPQYEQPSYGAPPYGQPGMPSGGPPPAPPPERG